MLDHREVGTRIATFDTHVERSRLRSFADAIGEERDIYRDVDAARAHGYPDLPIPPTFLAGLFTEYCVESGWFMNRGIDPRALLHGEQRFTYETMAFAGEELHGHVDVVDVSVKKNGELTLVTFRASIAKGNETVVTMDQTVVVQSRAKYQ